MAGEREKPVLPVFVPKGKETIIVVEGGPTIIIKNTSGSSIELKQIYPTSKEEQRDQVKAKLPSLVESYVYSSVALDAVAVTGGDVAGVEYELILVGDKLVDYFAEAKKAGIGVEEIKEDIEALLRRINIGQLKDGIMSPIIRKVKLNLMTFVDEVLETEKK